MTAMESRRAPNIERLLAAYHGTKLDRVPHFDYIDPKNVAAILGRDPAACRRNDWMPPEDQVRIARATGMDFIFAPCFYWPSAETPTGQWSSWDDLARIRPAPPAANVRAAVQLRLDAVRGTRLGVGVLVGGPFFTTYMNMGPIPIQSFLLASADNPALLARAMDIQLERQIGMIEALEGLPVSFVDFADDVCDNNGYMIRPALMEELWVPRMERLIAAMRSLSVPMTCHICGKLDPVVPNLLEWGIRAVHPVQVNCNDVYALKKAWGSRLCPIGNINIQGVLAFGTPAEVETDVREHIERLGQDGGYVCASSHSIVDAIPRENYRALTEAILKWG